MAAVAALAIYTLRPTAPPPVRGVHGVVHPQFQRVAQSIPIPVGTAECTQAMAPTGRASLVSK